MIDLQTPYVKLNKEEAKRLRDLFKQKYGNLTACSNLTKLHINTLKRAKDGLEITERSAKVIRKKLLNSEAA